MEWQEQDTIRRDRLRAGRAALRSGVARVGVPLSAMIVVVVVVVASWLIISWATRITEDSTEVPEAPELSAEGAKDGTESADEGGQADGREADAAAGADHSAEGGAGGAAGMGADGPADADGAGADGAGAADRPGGEAGAPEAGAGSDAPAQAIVQVVGAIEEPGVVEVPTGARVFEAVEAAGGLSDGAALEGLNMAAPVHDGMVIWVPTRDELKDGTPPPVGAVPAPGGPGAGAASAAPGAGGGAPTGPGAVADQTVNVNTADESELQELSGIGPALAQRIIEHRESNGPFASLEDLGAVRGIGPVILEDLSDKVTW